MSRKKHEPSSATILAEIAELSGKGASALPRLLALFNSREFSVKFAAASAICRIGRPVVLVWPAAEEERIEFARALLEMAHGPAGTMR